MSEDKFLRGYREVSGNIIPNRTADGLVDIRNVGSLPSGTGCKYLLCIRGEGDHFIAKQWKRTVPGKLLKTEFLISFTD